MLAELGPLLYQSEPFDRAAQRLVQVPAGLVVGLGNAIMGAGGALSALTPHFMQRGKLVGHIRKIAEADAFLTGAAVDLETIPYRLLREECSDRLIGGPGFTASELRGALQDWLDLTTNEPAARLAASTEELSFNANLARTALLGYYGLSSTRDARSGSSLPRLLFQSQPALGEKKESEEANAMSGWSKRLLSR